MMFTVSCVLAIACAVVDAAPASRGESEKPINIGSARQLFMDQLLIDRSRGVTLVANSPVKDLRRVIVPEKPWERGRVFVCSVIDDEDRVRLYYRGFDGSGEEYLCYAESPDGVHFTKPELDLFNYEGSTRNNIIALPTGDSPRMQGIIFKDRNPAAPKGERYKMWTSYTPPEGEDGRHGVWSFYSADGIRFIPYPDQPGIHRHSDTINVAFWDERLGRYVGFTRLWQGSRDVPDSRTRVIARTESPDFIHWGPEEVVAEADEIDLREKGGGSLKYMDFYNAAAIKYPYAADAYFIFTTCCQWWEVLEMWQAKGKDDLKPRYWPAVADLRLLSSRDGVSWQRSAGRHAFLRLGMEEDWDCGSLWMATGIVRKGNTLYQYYTGWNTPHSWERNLAKPGMGGVGLLRSRLDGFFSADASYTGGEILTIPVIFEGSRIELNIDTSAAGLCKVELQDADGTPIPGYTLDEADTLNGNSVAKLVTWQKKSDVSPLAGKPVRLRFVVFDCKLYAFGFTE